MIFDCIIIGAGASGLMAAVQLEKRKVNYLLLEKNEKAGKKLLITGGRRCNVTNNLDVEAFVDALTTKNKRFLYSALYQFGQNEIINFFKDNNLNLKLENNFKYFPETNKSSSVLAVLMQNINETNIIYNSKVKNIKKENDMFSVVTNDNLYQSRKVIVATGSKSYPITGSNGDGLNFAKEFKINCNKFTPAETHIFSKEIVTKYPNLQGTSIENATVRIKDTKHQNSGGLIFTHFGLSGPSIYHLSEFIYAELLKGKVVLYINLSALTKNELISNFKSDKNKDVFILKSIEKYLSKRLSRTLLKESGISNIKMNEISLSNLEKLATLICEFPVVVDKTETCEKAYVNKGGILTNELNPSTMESRKTKGLFFIGETVDIHGPIGGFNITIAFATAFLAGQCIGDDISA
jgi:predicted Rossmann fold flavoprotein